MLATTKQTPFGLDKTDWVQAMNSNHASKSNNGSGTGALGSEKTYASPFGMDKTDWVFASKAKKH